MCKFLHSITAALLLSSITVLAQTNSPIVGTWTWGGTTGKQGFCPTTLTIDAVSPDGDVQGRLHFIGGACVDQTRVFGEDQHPGIHAHFDGTWLKVWYLTNGTRF